MQYVDVTDNSNLNVALRQFTSGVREVVHAIDQLTQAVDRQTEQYKWYMDQILEGKRKD